MPLGNEGSVHLGLLDLKALLQESQHKIIRSGVILHLHALSVLEVICYLCSSEEYL